ncbi:MAG: hypothetical protein A3K19_07250 [Lentisphaerae bacterium RIFOXYB12_FULL_65_16]|nr:MAG: hypothetical protein A3K18_07120 [Lentisphaerae bacterium RIFOXYA12_64_32]OGV93318.1 MAG: hypothetical protein A3K19_07250 [Lentisphaerae bacterium RIFOXYB12_FULL_65_16]
MFSLHHALCRPNQGSEIIEQASTKNGPASALSTSATDRPYLLHSEGAQDLEDPSRRCHKNMQQALTSPTDQEFHRHMALLCQAPSNQPAFFKGK